MMHTRKTKKLIHEGEFAAEVEVELTFSDEGWSPYLSLEDAVKLDEVRLALRHLGVSREAPVLFSVSM